MAAIEMKNIVKQYGDGFPAVNDVSLDIADGEFMILVGPSGCGKSTLLRMIVGLEDITSGDMLIGGKRVNDQAPRDRNLSMVFQNYALYPHLTVFENIAFPLRLTRRPTTRSRRRVQRGRRRRSSCTEHLERKPANLSGGQRQRVAMGRAIVRQAEAFLFDEPLSNLDAKLRGQMRTEISRLQRRLGITTVYVTHDQTEAMTLGDRVCVLRKGKIQQVASPRELYEQPVNLFVAGFIGSPPMNFLPATLEGNAAADCRSATSSSTSERAAGRRRARPAARRHPAGVLRGRLAGRRAKRPLGSTFRARVDVTEWLGDSAVRLHPLRGAGRRSPRSCASCRGSWTREELRTQAVVSHRLDQPDPRGPRGGVLARHPQGPRLRPGDRRQPHAGRRSRRRAHPSGQPGPARATWRRRTAVPRPWARPDGGRRARTGRLPDGDLTAIVVGTVGRSRRPNRGARPVRAA